MRISLIHGEDTIKAYEKYRSLVDGSKKKGFDIIQISDLKSITSQSLFEDKIVFTLEKPNKIKLNDWKWFSKNASGYNSNLLIYFDGIAGVSITKYLPKDTKQEKFDLPKIIFSFLDSFFPGNSHKSLKLFNEVIVHEPVELVFHLLARHLRDLYWAKTAKETMQIPDWRVLKLSNQVNKFKDDKLEKIINELSEIDIKSKTSNESLKNLLDIVIMKRLK